MTRIQANLLLTLAAVIWGSSFVVQQIGTGELGTISFTGARFLVGALIVLPFALRQLRRVERQERQFQARDWLGITLTGGVLLCAASLQQYGILRTTVTNSGFLTALYVPLVPLLGLLVLRRKVHFTIWPASICCFVGTFILSGAQHVALVAGDLWVISSTVFWATHVMLVGIMASRTRAPLVVAAGQFLVCGGGGWFLDISSNRQAWRRSVELSGEFSMWGFFPSAWPLPCRWSGSVSPRRPMQRSFSVPRRFLRL